MNESFTVTIRASVPFARLAHYRPAFAPLARCQVPAKRANRWLRDGRNSHDLQVVFTGKTGYGKSTTLNQLTGQDCLATSDVAPCTRACQCVDFRLGPDRYLSFGDLPGLGDTEARDEAYLESYRQFLAKAQVVVHVLRADQRDLREDERMWETLGRHPGLLIGLNQVDKLEPWHPRGTRHLATWQAHLIAKQEAIATACGLPVARVVPYSARTDQGLDELARAIVAQLTR